jgi:hypothetical protein
MSLDTFCLQSFHATDAAFRTSCVLFNLLLGLREALLPSRWFDRQMQAMRDMIFMVRADLTPETRRLRIQFALPAAERLEFIQQLRTLFHTVPIAAQLEWDLSERDDAQHAPSRPPHTIAPTVQLIDRLKRYREHQRPRGWFGFGLIFVGVALPHR